MSLSWTTIGFFLGLKVSTTKQVKVACTPPCNIWILKQFWYNYDRYFKRRNTSWVFIAFRVSQETNKVEKLSLAWDREQYEIELLVSTLKMSSIFDCRYTPVEPFLTCRDSYWYQEMDFVQNLCSRSFAKCNHLLMLSVMFRS